MSNLIKPFVEGLISDAQQANVVWNEGCSEVLFRKLNDSGFDVTVGVDSGSVYLFTDRGYNNHWHLEYFSSEEQALETVFEQVRKLLNGHMRIRELRSNNKPYKWVLEVFHAGKWRNEAMSSLLFWNWFGKRSHHCYLNSTSQPGAAE
ncbi:hypothetical protein EZV61_19150 [Corallincola luteus]|uniref:Uncharacterized protein n=1 Tax=Corallincola luteus TaxID=1775177 RepID=A0ABY2AJB5_9GAMM|nr:hypothetical protein [Corallincola luteus]TCI01128.1 hypothetical protein EZV61_19150 [Corallincola luteus]